MKRFRVTLIAICLILGWLGYADLSLLLRNPEPYPISISDLEAKGAPREWLSVRDGYQDLLQAINMSGTMEIDAFLVPLKPSRGTQEVRIWFETRDQQIIELLKTYYFYLDSDAQRERFLADNQDFLTAKRDLTGMTADDLVADSNRQKLLELLQEMKIPIPEDVIFISEGKKPAMLRGIFFAAMALIGFLKLLFDLRKPAGGEQAQPDQAAQINTE